MAQQWEYLEVVLTAQGWLSSDGQAGIMEPVPVMPSGGSAVREFPSLAPPLSRFGAQGWELVGVIPPTPETSSRCRLIFKQARPGTPA